MPAAKAHLENRVKKNLEESRAPKMIFLIVEPNIVFILSDQSSQQGKAIIAIMPEHPEKGCIKSDCILLPECYLSQACYKGGNVLTLPFTFITETMAGSICHLQRGSIFISVRL